MNILIAEDDGGMSCLLQEVLGEIPDANVIISRDGAEAWWWLTAPDLKYALAILDMKMPGINGLTLLSRMRETPQFRTLPVIMCTGMSDRSSIGKAAHLAVSHYLIKPFNPETLLEKVQELLPKRSGRDVVIV